MKKRHVIGLLVLSVALSHALAPAIAWAQAKAQNAFYSLTVTDTVTASGDVTADQYVASGSASQYSCSKTDGTCQFSSATADGTTSSTVGSFTFKAGANITAADLLLDVQDSAGAHAFTVTEAGTATALAGLVIGSAGLSSSSTLKFTNLGTGVWIDGASGAMYPAADGTIKLGLSSLKWSEIHGAVGTFTGNVTVADLTGDASVRGTCTLDGASPSKCTATVTAAAICVCTGVGTTAAVAAAGCAASLSGTTLTLTSANGLSHNVNYHCFL